MCPLCHPGILALQLDPKTARARFIKERKRRTATKCKNSLAAFFRESWKILEPTTPLADSWVYDVLGSHYEAQFANWRARKQETFIDEALQDPLQNLMVNLPPGTAKSRFFSVAAVAWSWLQDPSFSVIAVSKNPSVVRRDADILRSLIQSEWYTGSFAPQWIMREDRNAIGMFQLQGKSGKLLGWRKSSGILGAIVGERCDLLLVDDPHDPYDVLKGNAEALTKPIDVFDNSLYNRVNNPALSMRIVVAHRVHKHDLSGHLLSKKHQTWLHLKIPLRRKEAHKQTVVGWDDPRKRDERIFPSRYTEAAIATDEENFGDMAAALHDQEPGDFANAIFKGEEFRWFRFADRVPYGRRPSGASLDPARVIDRLNNQRYFEQVLISVDANAARKTSTAKGSYVGLQVWGIIGHDKFLIDVRSAPLGFNDMVAAVNQCFADYPEADKALFENKANGPAAMAQLEDDIEQMEEINPSGSKEGRARATTGQVKAGRVYVQEGQPWNERWCAQVFSFPFTPDGRNDDVDAMTQVLNWAKTTDFSERFAALAAM